MSRVATAGASTFHYQEALEVAKAKGLSNVSTRQGNLVLALPMSDTDPNYSFNINEEYKGEIRKVLKGLETNNSFVASGFGLMIAKVPITLTAANQEKAFWGNAEYFSYADPRAFTGAAPYPGTVAGWATEAQALRTVFAGSMAMQIESITVLEDFHTANFEFVPQTQSGANTVNNSPKYVTKSLGKSYHLYGDKDNTVTINIGSGDYKAVVGDIPTSVGEMGHRNYLVWIASGFLIKGSAASVRIAA
jgi:hypothetical protein